MVRTPYGDFKIQRKGTVAITVVSAKRPVRHHRTDLVSGDVTHIEHRRIPTHRHKVYVSWAKYIGSFDLEGNLIELVD